MENMMTFEHLIQYELAVMEIVKYVSKKTYAVINRNNPDDTSYYKNMKEYHQKGMYGLIPDNSNVIFSGGAASSALFSREHGCEWEFRIGVNCIIVIKTVESDDEEEPTE